MYLLLSYYLQDKFKWQITNALLQAKFKFFKPC